VAERRRKVDDCAVGMEEHGRHSERKVLFLMRQRAARVTLGL
jgi:hypothetical protein